jgi:hypothetical protein
MCASQEAAFSFFVIGVALIDQLGCHIGLMDTMGFTVFSVLGVLGQRTHSHACVDTFADCAAHGSPPGPGSPLPFCEWSEWSE